MRKIFLFALVLVFGLSSSVFAQSGSNSNGFIRLGLNQVATSNIDSMAGNLFGPGVEMGPTLTTLGNTTSMVIGLYSYCDDFNGEVLNVGFETGDLKYLNFGYLRYLKYGVGYLLNSVSDHGELFPYGAITLNILENNTGSLYVNMRTGLTEKHVDLNIGYQFKIR